MFDGFWDGFRLAARFMVPFCLTVWLVYAELAWLPVDLTHAHMR